MNNRTRLDQKIVELGFAESRSQAANQIKLGFVTVDGKEITKSGYFVCHKDKISFNQSLNYVSRAGLKLEAANKKFKINFKNKIVLDAGSSTGGFTDYALQNGSGKVVAVDVGTDQLHPKLRQIDGVELHEKTDIRDFMPKTKLDIILADLSFISLRKILPHLAQISDSKTQLIVLLKPQFEAQREQTNRGVIKNDKVRRQIMKDFEIWVQKLFKIVDKIDSQVPGEKGNLERFYLLKTLPRR